jgi:nucleoid DNA-binding protein
MWLKFNELAWIIVFKFLYLQTQKNYYNIINKEENDESRYQQNFRKIRSWKGDVQATVETLWMKLKFIRDWRQCIFKRFWSFIVKTRAEKTGRNISKNTTIKSTHNIPAFKPKSFCRRSKTNNETKYINHKI